LIKVAHIKQLLSRIKKSLHCSLISICMIIQENKIERKL